MATVLSPPLTLEEFARLPKDGACHEMNAGELLTLPPPKSLHSRLARSVFLKIESVLGPSSPNEAFFEAGYVLSRDPLTIRQPDISILSRERIRATDPDSYFEGAPELAVEVVSSSESAEDLDIKTRQYLQNGGQQVWIVYPKTQTVHVFSGGTAAIILDHDQILDGGDLLPGFQVSVALLFAI